MVGIPPRHGHVCLRFVSGLTRLPQLGLPKNFEMHSDSDVIPTSPLHLEIVDPAALLSQRVPLGLDLLLHGRSECFVLCCLDQELLHLCFELVTLLCGCDLSGVSMGGRGIWMKILMLNRQACNELAFSNSARKDAIACLALSAPFEASSACICRPSMPACHT